MDINRLPLVQVKILLRILDDPNHMGFAEGRDEGGSIKELNNKGLVQAAGKVGRRIRWKLVINKLKDEDIKSLRKLVVNDYFDYEIEEWSDGFQILPGTLSLIASFIVKKEEFVAGFAFRIGYLDWVSRHLKNDDLIPKAKSLIKHYLDKGNVKHLDELTFDFNYPNFTKVDDAKWWTKSIKMS